MRIELCPPHQIEPVVIGIVEFHVEDYVERCWRQKIEDLRQIMPFRPRRSFTVGFCAPAVEWQAAFPLPPRFGVRQFDPAAPYGQMLK